MDVDSSDIKRLTTDALGQSCSMPIWLDNNTVSYMYRNSLFSIFLDDDVANATEIYKPASNVNSVESRVNHITFVSAVYPDTSLAQSSERSKQEAGKTLAQVYDNLWPRYWDEWMALKKPTLFAAPLVNNGGKWSVGTETNVMKCLSQFHDPLINWSVDSYSIDNLGKNIALVVRNPSDDMAVTPRVDIYLVSADSSAKPKLLTGSFNAIADSPVFTKDGKYLAWLQMETPGYESDINRIYIYDIEAGTRKSVAREWDRSPESIVWSADGQTIFAVATDQGNDIIFAINVTTGNCTRMTDTGSAMGLSTLGENQLLFQYTEQNKCVDIHILDIETKEMRRLTDVNSDKLRNVDVDQIKWLTEVLLWISEHTNTTLPYNLDQ
ncbi:dipeptidylpeptidase [Kickxella alabastrina]|uniref:Dipeptidylpeptidase n=1 Tax=Kickxella alabastrina TaxID=61397 RepID=A0ACC1IN38_9FUNG|nr:dipeptidylpeptidase [Kickxella alabastrina]